MTLIWKIVRVIWLPLVIGLTMILTMLAQQVGLLNFDFFAGQKQMTVTVILDRVQALSNLTTAKYTYSGIVTSQRQMPALLAALYGDKLALMAVGHITAGVDLQKLAVTDVTLQDGVLRMTLPAPALTECFLDEQASYVVTRDTGIFASDAANLDTEARRYALSQFTAAAIESGILTDAQAQADVAIKSLIGMLGTSQITRTEVSFKPADPAALPPPTCG